MLYPSLLPALRDVLEPIRQRKRVDEVVRLILEKACSLARATHGCFVLVDHETRRLTIAQVFGADWTAEKRLCHLAIGQGLTGRVAATGQPLLCVDTEKDPNYYPLFDHVRSELIVPVVVKDRVWGLINIDGLTPNAFDETTLQLLTVFAELAAFAITLRLEMSEQDRLYKKLLQSEKLASLGEALAGIAHEINNPLTAILSYASLLEMQAHDAAERDALGIIVSESKRAATLIKGVLEFSRKETGQRELTDMNALVREVVALRQFQSKSPQVKLVVHPGSSRCQVMACPQQLKQVLLNLVANAEHAISPSAPDGTVTLSVSDHGAHVQVTVRDNGRGIPAEARKFIFDPFFTTKGPGEGTGLGLSIAYSIMEAHGGSIRLTSSTPAGTVFTLRLPLVASEIHPPRISLASASNTTPAPLRGRVLLVDDEPHILEPIAAYLNSLTIDVCQAHCGQSALKLLQARPVDVVISDIRMPGMDGLQLYAAARQLDPNYEHRFVFISGYLLRESTNSFLATTGLPYLEKPFSFDELRRVLAPFLRTAKPFPSAQVPAAVPTVETDRFAPIERAS